MHKFHELALLTMRSTFFLLLSLFAFTANAQKTTLLVPKKGTQPAPAPATYSTPTPAATVSFPAQTDSRRAAAVAKVQKRAPATTAKSVAPANGDLSPVTYSTVSEIAPDPGTTVTVNGQERFRDVRAGKGQIHFGVFTPVDELYFVQFGVFCKDTPVTHAPAVDGVYLVWHAESTCPSGDKGAAYIVKGLPTAEEAKEEAKLLKAQGIDCWYNPALTGAKVEIIGVR
ncbi:MAG TPA: hypothetical protein PLO67_12480 [Saprospiraceae bacterium]|nr:hypothetical protein [Saprospiraceae bacterium]HPI06710.1 hypothetical protein [Saprospiraceae bacterium]